MVAQVPKVENLTIYQGADYEKVIRWEGKPVVFKAITGISLAAPCVITAVNHAVPTGWRVAISGVRGTVELNAERAPPAASDYYIATPLTSDTLALDGIDASGFRAYVSGGYVQYNTPVTLSGFTARMDIREGVGATTALLQLSTVAGTIVIDESNYKITLALPAATTEAITWTRGVYDLELVSATGVVFRLLSGSVTVSPNVTV